MDCQCVQYQVSPHAGRFPRWTRHACQLRVPVVPRFACRAKGSVAYFLLKQ
jgi:hypothetical protein